MQLSTRQPFKLNDTFISYSDEKQNTGEQLAKVLSRIKTSSKMDILDIGCGNGQLLARGISKINSTTLDLVLLDPDSKSLKQAKESIDVEVGRNVELVNKRFEEYVTSSHFNTVICSHTLYAFARNERPSVINKMLDLLKEDAILILIVRQEDDIYRFKSKFRPMIIKNDEFKALTLDETIGWIDAKRWLIQKKLVNSTLKFPIYDSLEKVKELVEFHLNISWNSILPEVQSQILQYIREKDGVFRLIDGIAVIRAK